MERFRADRISEDEIDMFYPMAEMEYYNWVADLKDDSDARKMFDNWLKNGRSKEEMELGRKMFAEADADNSGRLDRGEWMGMARKGDEMAKKMLGDDAPDRSAGDQ